MYRLGMLVAILLGAALGFAMGAGYTVAFGQEGYGSCSVEGEIAFSADSSGHYRCNGRTWQWVDSDGEYGYGLCSIENETAKSSDPEGHYICKNGSWTWVNEELSESTFLSGQTVLIFFGGIMIAVALAAVVSISETSVNSHRH